MISTQKDRVIIIGGKDRDGSDTKIVEEIDFLKRNSVNLAYLKCAKSQAQSFLVNDTIYSFWGFNGGEEVNESEKYVIRENKWKEIISKEVDEVGKEKVREMGVLGPAALLYE